MTTTVANEKAVVDVLRDARMLLAAESHWVQGALAMDESGRPVNPLAEAAVCWCLEGAIMRADADLDFPHAGPALAGPAFGAVMAAIGGDVISGRHRRSPAQFNDAAGRTHADILRVLDAAIATAEAA